MGQFTSFDGLPNEIHANILVLVASPEDVSSMIKASSGSLRALVEHRSRILRAVLERVHPQILVEMLGILYAPKYEDFKPASHTNDTTGDEAKSKTPELGNNDNDGQPEPQSTETASNELEVHEKWAAWEEHRDNFVRDHFTKVEATKRSSRSTFGTLPHKMPNSPQDILFLARLYGTLKRMTWEYVSFTHHTSSGSITGLSNLKTSFKRVGDGELVRPMRVEQLRIQRGFLRYQLCSALYGLPYLMTAFEPWSDSQDRKGSDGEYMKHLQFWEKEEVACIKTFVQRQLCLIFKECEDDFQGAVKRLSRARTGEETPEDTTSVARLLKSSGDYSMGYFTKSKCEDASGRNKADIWITNFCRLGIVYLQGLLRSGRAERRWALRATFESLGKSSFKHDCEAEGDGISINERFLFVYTLLFSDPPDGCNKMIHSVLEKIIPESKSRPTIPGLKINRLRGLGWAFWDNEAMCFPHSYFENGADYPWRICDDFPSSFRPARDLRASRSYTMVSEDDWDKIIIGDYGVVDYTSERPEAFYEFLSDARKVSNFEMSL